MCVCTCITCLRGVNNVWGSVCVVNMAVCSVCMSACVYGCTFDGMINAGGR